MLTPEACWYQRLAGTRTLLTPGPYWHQDFAGIRSSLRPLRNFLPLPAFLPCAFPVVSPSFSCKHFSYTTISLVTLSWTEPWQTGPTQAGQYMHIRFVRIFSSRHRTIYEMLDFATYCERSGQKSTKPALGHLTHSIDICVQQIDSRGPAEPSSYSKPATGHV